MAGPAAALAGVALTWAAVTALRPADAGPTFCPWRSMTGLDCPLCGATRAAASLGHGDVIAALDHNAFFVLVLLPLSVLAWRAWATSSWRGRPLPIIRDRTIWILMGITLVWWVLRLWVPWLGSSAG